KYSRLVSRKKLDELSRNVRGSVSDRRGEFSLFANCVKRRKKNVRTDGQRDIFFRVTFHPSNNYGCGKTRVLQNPLPNKRCDLARRRSVREAAFGDTARLRKFALFVPATEAVNFIATDFYVQVSHGNKAWKRGDFILCAKD